MYTIEELKSLSNVWVTSHHTIYIKSKIELRKINLKIQKFDKEELTKFIDLNIIKENKRIIIRSDIFKFLDFNNTLQYYFPTDNEEILSDEDISLLLRYDWLIDTIDCGKFQPIFLESPKKEMYDEKRDKEISELIGTKESISKAEKTIHNKYNYKYKEILKLYLKDFSQSEGLKEIKSILEECFKLKEHPKKELLWKIAIEFNEESYTISTSHGLHVLCDKYKLLSQLITD